MPRRDPRVDAYIDNAAPFAKPILKRLRKIVHAGCPKVEETIKWNFPSFMHRGILCGMAAFKQHCVFGFWKAELIFDGERRSDREAMGNFGKIMSLDDLPDDKKLIGYVRKAARLNETGAKSPARSKSKKRTRAKVPDYFAAALKKNAKAKHTFDNLSPSHQREYIEWLTGAKRDETRARRLKLSIQWLAQGKPQNWRYMPEWR